MRRLFYSRKPYLAERLRKHAALLGLAALTGLGGTFGAPAPAFAQSADQHSADQHSEAELLQKLKKASAEEAESIARDIRRLWARSGSASADLLLKRGRDALKARNHRLAIAHLTALTDHAPDFAEGWHLRASAYFAVKLYGPAIADLGRALALNPQHFEAIRGLAALFEQLGEPEQAYEGYRQVLTIHPHHPDGIDALKRLEARVKGPAL